MGRNVEAAAVARAPAGAVPAADTTAPTAYVDKVVQWIPSEAVGGYLAVWGILTPTTDASRWGIFGFGLAVVLVLSFLGVALAAKATKAKWEKDGNAGNAPSVSSKDRFLLLLFAAIAFSSWVGALTDSPFISIDDNASKVGSASLIVLALLIPKIAEALDLSPQS